MSKAFNEVDSIAEFMNSNNLIVIDGLNLAFRYKHAKMKNYATKYLETVQSLASSYAAKNIIVLADGGSIYREGIYSDYKGNRKELREKQTEEEAQDFKDFITEFNKTLELIDLSYPTIKFDGVEADDIAAYIVKYHSNDFDKIWLVSSDKDWDLLISEKTSRFSYVTRKEVTLENWSEHYDYEPDDHISIKVLAGDKGDNVPGVDGIGIKRAITLIKEYGTAFDIYDSLPIQSKYKYIKNLNEFNHNLLLNYELMDLVTYCDEALGKDNCTEVDRIIEERL